MAQTGYTPIQIYYSTTTTNAPSAGNLLSGELAINITDGKMFYKDNGGSVQVIAWKTTPTTAGGTGLTSWTAGDLPYYSTGTTLTKLGIGTNGQVLTSTGTAPQWSTLSGVAVTTFSAGTTGFTPSTATSGAVTLAGTLATTNGGTGLTSFTANGVVYASSSSALTTGSALVFDGTNLGIGTTSPTGWGRTVSVSNTSTDSGFTFEGSTRKWGIGGGFTDGALRIYDFTAATESMRISATGDVGIGTSSPVYKLDVSGSVIRLNNSGSTADIFLTDSGTTNGHVRLRGESNAMKFITGNGISATLDSSGNLGLGVTPSAWSSLWSAEQFGQAGSLFSYKSGSNYTVISNNSYAAGGNYQGTDARYTNDGYATAYVQNNSGQHLWLNAASGTAGVGVTFTQAMTLGADGNLLVGTTSSTSGIRLDVQGASGANSYVRTTSVGNSTRSGFRAFGKTSGGADVQLDFIAYGDSPEAGLNVVTNHPLTFATNNTERARITSGGDLLVGTTDSGSGATAAKQRIIGAAANNLYLGSTSAGGWRITSDALNDGGTFYHIKFTENGTERGSITSNGTITTYNTTSDYRLKTVIGPVANAGQRIDALQPVEYTWNADGSRTRGFLAHQFQEVYASSVSGTKDAVDAEGKPVYQAMQASTSEVIADLVAEIQSLRARVAALESQA
jgi:hypothetical protein